MLYEEQYDLGYWTGYTATENASLCGGVESSRSLPEPVQSSEPTNTQAPTDVVSAMGKKVHVLPVPLGEGTSKAAEVVNTDPLVVILEEIPLLISTMYYDLLRGVVSGISYFWNDISLGFARSSHMATLLLERFHLDCVMLLPHFKDV